MKYTYKVVLTSALMGVSFLLSSKAQANELPRYDVETHCKEVAGFGGAPSSMIMNGCMDMEQKSYNQLKQMWPSVSNETKAHCREVSAFGGGNYMTLKGCIDMEQRAASTPRKFSY